VDVGAGVVLVGVGVVGRGVCVRPAPGELEVLGELEAPGALEAPGVLEGVAVGVLPGVSAGTGVLVLSFAVGFASLPQATSSSPIASTPAVAARRALFHPRVGISANLLFAGVFV
jgi:hypothetical protein